MSIFSITTRVRYKETDKGGRVYHSNYLVWLDMARTEYFRHNGVNYAEMEEDGIFLVVRKADLTYFSPALFDQIIKISLISIKTNKIKVDIHYEISDNDTGKILVKAFTQLVSINKSGKPIKIPEKLNQVLNN